jgi:hypothetical protein
VSTRYTAFVPVDLAQSEQLPLPQRHFQNLSCWIFVQWMLGGPVARVTPLARLQNLPHLPRFCNLRRQLHHSRPKSVRYLSLGQHLPTLCGRTHFYKTYSYHKILRRKNSGAWLPNKHNTPRDEVTNSVALIALYLTSQMLSVRLRGECVTKNVNISLTETDKFMELLPFRRK